MNQFICVTSNGGHFGRICWINSDAPGNLATWGCIVWMPITIFGTWAGSIPIVRYLTR